MKKSINAKTSTAKGYKVSESLEFSTVLRKISETISAIEQYKAENPDIDVDALLSEQKELLPVLEQISSGELNKFVAYAKSQGTKMSFNSMETGVLAAGRKDMQSGLAEILNSLEFDKPECSDCNEEMDNRGRSKKKL